MVMIHDLGFGDSTAPPLPVCTGMHLLAKSHTLFATGGCTIVFRRRTPKMLVLDGSNLRKGERDEARGLDYVPAVVPVGCRSPGHPDWCGSRPEHGCKERDGGKRGK